VRRTARCARPHHGEATAGRQCCRGGRACAALPWVPGRRELSSWLWPGFNFSVGFRRNFGSLIGSHLWPWAFIECLAGRNDRTVNVCCISFCHPGNHFPGARVQSRESLARCSINEFAVDKELCLAHLDRRRNGLLCCCRSAEPLKESRQQSTCPICPAERGGDSSGRRSGPGEQAAGGERGGGPPRGGSSHDDLSRARGGGRKNLLACAGSAINSPPPPGSEAQ